jgi:hypothetical protein
MITVDADISGSVAAERSVLDKVRKVTSGRVQTLNSVEKKANRQIKSVCRNAGLPDPAAVNDVRELFLRHRLVNL